MTVNRRGVFNVEALMAAVEAKRESLGISGREVARQAGLAGAAMTFLRRGVMPSTETLARVLLWLGETDLAPFINRRGAEMNEDQKSGEAQIDSKLLMAIARQRAEEDYDGQRVSSSLAANYASDPGFRLTVQAAYRAGREDALRWAADQIDPGSREVSVARRVDRGMVFVVDADRGTATKLRLWADQQARVGVQPTEEQRAREEDQERDEKEER